MRLLVRNLYLPLFASIVLISCSDQEEVQNDTSELVTALVSDIDNSISESDHDVLQAWTALYLELERYSSGRPNATARATAYIYLTAYETVVPGLDDYASLDNRLRNLQISNRGRGSSVDWQLALNESLSVALSYYLLNVSSDRMSDVELLRSMIEESLSSNLSEEEIEDSKEWGAYVAEQVVAYSQKDEDAEEQILDPQPLSYEPPTGDGFWTYSADPERALFPYWESVRTFVVEPDETSTVAPIEYSEEVGSDYYNQMLEIYESNNDAREESGEQLWIAEFWSDDVEGLMMSPPARQVSIATQLVDEYELTLQESLAMYLKLGFSLNDAAVATWKYKYDYMVMRPNVYIHEFIDPDFQTNLYRLIYWPNPSFPGYPSGHSSFASAAAGIFIDFFGDATSFTDFTHDGRTEFQGDARFFSTFSDMAYENAFSRVPLGVHMSMDCEEGLRLGYEIAAAVNEFDLSSERKPQ